MPVLGELTAKLAPKSGWVDFARPDQALSGATLEENSDGDSEEEQKADTTKSQIDKKTLKLLFNKGNYSTDITWVEYVKAKKADERMIPSKHNRLTVGYQNEERLRSGKYSQARQADNSVRWVLDAYMNLNSLSKNLVTVPVSTSYDRVFESENLTQEVSGP